MARDYLHTNSSTITVLLPQLLVVNRRTNWGDKTSARNQWNWYLEIKGTKHQHCPLDGSDCWAKQWQGCGWRRTNVILKERKVFVGTFSDFEMWVYFREKMGGTLSHSAPTFYINRICIYRTAGLLQIPNNNNNADRWQRRQYPKYPRDPITDRIRTFFVTHTRTSLSTQDLAHSLTSLVAHLCFTLFTTVDNPRIIVLFHTL